MKRVKILSSVSNRQMRQSARENNCSCRIANLALRDPRDIPKWIKASLSLAQEVVRLK